MTRILMTLLLLAVVAPARGELSLVEKPVDDASQPYLVVLLTGDGGWRKIDAELTREMNAHHIPVIGFLSNRYFMTLRTPEEVGRDVGSVMTTYAARWKRSRIILIGYSRGGDTVPIVLSQIPPELRSRIAIAAMLGPALTAELRIHHWWSVSADPPFVYLAPLVHSLSGTRLLCFYGREEKESLCPVLSPGDAVSIVMPGGHHFAGAYAAIARAILDALKVS